MADVPKTGMPYSELPEKEEFDENDEIFCLNEGYGERAKVSTFVDEVAGMGNADHMISDAFDEERDYTAGEYCIYDNSLYKFTEDKEAGEWDDNIVEITTVSGEIQENTDLIDSSLPSDAMCYRSLLTSSDDLNDLFTTGIYNANSSSMPENSPLSNAGVFIVFFADNYAAQMYFRAGTANGFYFRVYQSGSGNGWRSWVQVTGTTI